MSLYNVYARSNFVFESGGTYPLPPREKGKFGGIPIFLPPIFLPPTTLNVIEWLILKIIFDLIKYLRRAEIFVLDPKEGVKTRVWGDLFSRHGFCGGILGADGGFSRNASNRLV